MAISKRLLSVGVFLVLAVVLNLGISSEARANAWGDLLCGIDNGSAEAVNHAIDLYNRADNDINPPRQCKTAIVFNAKQTVHINNRVVIDRLPPDGKQFGFSIRKCIPSGPYADPMPCPAELDNDDVELDFSGVTDDGGDCPVLVKADTKIDFRRIKLIVKNPSKAVCTYEGKANIAKDSDNNPNNNSSNPMDSFAWIASDVTIVGPSGGNVCDNASVNDNNACTTDTCNPTTGVVTHTPIDTNDHNSCTTDACDPSSGVTHTPVSTDDGNACTTDACNPSSGVTHTAVAVDDGNACTADACDSSTGTVTHTPTAVDDSNACTADACDPSTGTVTHNPLTVDDGNSCTTDACDPTSGVTHTPVTVDDGDACTVDTCDSTAGVVHTPIPGCPGGTPPAPTCDLVAATAATGFDLTWTSLNGTAATLTESGTPGNLSTDLNSAAPLNVNPLTPKTYTLTVTGAGGSCTDSITLVSGSPVPTAPTCTLTSSAASGGTFDLTWTTSGATSVTLDEGSGANPVAANDTKNVTPAAPSTTYTLLATSAGGSCSKAVTLSPPGGGTPPPTCTLTSVAASGGGFDLTWTSTNGTTASLSDGSTTLSTDLNSSAAQHVSPSSSTTYTLTVNGAGGVCSRAVTLSPGTTGPGAAPTCDLSSTAVSGGGFDITWTSSNGTSADLKEGDTTISSDSSSSSAHHVNPTSPTLYLLTITGPGGVCSRGLLLSPPPSGSGSTPPANDSDGDGIPDTIENSFGTDPHNPDSDGDGLKDGDEILSPYYPACGPTNPDCDGDGVCDGPGTVKDAANNVICQPVTEGQGDNCPLVSNGPNTKDIASADIQKDTDANGVGDACEGDMDGDTVGDDVDNCKFIPNKEQEDADANGIGNACDPGFSTSQGGGGGCGCRMDASSANEAHGAEGVLFLLLSMPMVVMRLRRRAMQ